MEIRVDNLPAPRRLVMWALTYRCNLRCEYCYLFTAPNSTSLARQEADASLIGSIAESLTARTNWRPEIVWLTGGEPTLHPQLLDLIDNLESNGIMTVVTTDGVVSEDMARRLSQARPRGIMISLDLADPVENDSVRGGGNRVLKTIDLIAKEKSSYTTLGVSVVVHNKNHDRLQEFARFLGTRGVNYLSLNPLHILSEGSVALSNKTEFGTTFSQSLETLSKETEIALPSALYLSLLRSHFESTPPVDVLCPAAHEYAFIAPWGSAYPCSCEFWHRDERMHSAPSAAQDFTNVLAQLRLLIKSERFSSNSPCYSTRCMGCWKLYYDSVFLPVQ